MSTGTLSIDLDALNKQVGLEPEPQAPTTDALAGRADLVVQQGPQAMVCRDMLDEATRARAQQIARAAYPALVADPNQLAQYGNEAVAGINAMASRMLDRAGRAANIPELVQLTNELDDRMRALGRKYNKLQIGETRESYEKMKARVRDFINRYRDMLHMLVRDAKGLQAYLDSVEAQLTEKQGQLNYNVQLCNELYAENEQAIQRLVGVIAIMEFIADEGREAMKAIVIDDSAPDARARREERDRISEFVQALDVRIGEFKQRLFVAWATSPQVRNIRAISYGLGQRLGLLIALTIPVFKLTVVQWVALMEADQAAQVTSEVAGATDTAMDLWAAAAGELVPKAAKAIQTPSMSPDTIVRVADSLATQAEGFAEALRFGIESRKAVETAVMKAASSMAASSDKQARLVTELVVAANKPPLQLPPAPEVSTDVLELAPPQLVAPAA